MTAQLTVRPALFSKALTALTLVALASTLGCDAGEELDAGTQHDAVTLEIVDNLVAAGYPESEIEVREGGVVFVGGDAEVSLDASREIAGRRSVPAETDDAFRQYRTTNLVASSVDTICVDGSAFSGTISTALDTAIANYNNEGLSFTMVRTSGSSAGCDAVITGHLVSGTGGQAGFPANGLPFADFDIGSDIPGVYGLGPTTHVVMHELGHCIGLRHSDYYDRSISCNKAGNEGQAAEGAHHIPGTPTSATWNGSVMNACYNNTSTGQWTGSDQIALDELYGSGNNGAGPNSCVASCGGNAGQCWCDDLCTFYGDCCADKVDVCDAPAPTPLVYDWNGSCVNTQVGANGSVRITKTEVGGGVYDVVMEGNLSIYSPTYGYVRHNMLPGLRPVSIDPQAYSCEIQSVNGSSTSGVSNYGGSGVHLRADTWGAYTNSATIWFPEKFYNGNYTLTCRWQTGEANDIAALQSCGGVSIISQP